MGIFDDLYGTPQMRGLFSDATSVQRMLDVEAALARAEAHVGLVPPQVADSIASAARVERVDLDAIAESTKRVGYPIVAVAKQLGLAAGGDAPRYVHLGATTQDILDTALVLQLRDGLQIVERELAAIAKALVARAVEHRTTVMAGRTHLQQAVPITFGYKCALWAAPLLEHIAAVRASREGLVVQFGGAAGTLASLGERGREVCVTLARELKLKAPDAPWHGSRVLFAQISSLLGIVCGSLAKFATDVALLMQTEVAEVFEPYESGRGSSSTMPQKRNPIASEYVLASTRGVHALVPMMLGAMAGDHERSTGAWQSERIALPQIFILTGGALLHARTIAEGMTIDAARMRENLDRGGGLIMAEAVAAALTGVMGRDAAHHAVERACAVAAEGEMSFADALAADQMVGKCLGGADLDALFDPSAYLGDALGVVDRVAAAAREVLHAAG